jgi:hypothetical protein
MSNPPRPPFLRSFGRDLLALGAYVLVLFHISGWLVLSLAVATPWFAGAATPSARCRPPSPF